MENLHQLCFMKSLLLCSLSFLLIQGAPTSIDKEHEIAKTDVISATDMECEIRSSCSSSWRCPQTHPMTVDLDSRITLKCAILNGGLVEGMTWKEAKEAVLDSTGSSELVLQTVSTYNIDYSCQCKAIVFTRALRIVQITGSPNLIIHNKRKKLKCVFSGWPLPPKVHWYKDGQLITNETKHTYYSEDKKRKNGEDTFQSILHLPEGCEEQEGFYTCSATNSIHGWSSSASATIQMIYKCPLSRGPTIHSPQINASASSNVNLSCLMDFDSYCPDRLFWYLNDKPKPLPESGEKYKAEIKETHTKCMKEFILHIFNVTKNDEGTYSCHWLCEYETTTKAAIDLIVDDEVEENEARFI